LLVTPARREALERIVLHATRLRIPIVEVEGGTLTAIAGFDGHQGVALVVGPRSWATVEEIIGRATAAGEAPFVLAMDSLEDPQNVGTLLRSAEAAGVHGVLFPTHRQAPLTPAAVKASAGAIEHLALAPVDDLAAALAELHIRGLRIVGSDADAPLTLRQADLRGPIALVVGSEGRGLGAGVRRRCDLVVRIPMRGRVGSLNAAVAGSLLVFEAVSQRDPEGTHALPSEDRIPEADEAAEVEAASAPVVAEAGAAAAPESPEVAEAPRAAEKPSPSRTRRASSTGSARAQPKAGTSKEAKPKRPTPKETKPKRAKSQQSATSESLTAEDDVLPA
jgi:23S rRNA (guanosine2251-2'-O)-methyltransferase